MRGHSLWMLASKNTFMEMNEMSTDQDAGGKLNVLRIAWVTRLLASRWFPLVPQILMFAVLALLILGGLGVTTDDPAFAKVLRNTNLANLIVWSYWWPVIIIAAVLLGRVWCTVCPIELVSYLGSRVGLRRRAPAWLRSGWAITIFYAVILLVGIHTLAIHRLPHRMALYLLGLAGVAILVSLVFDKRAFCSYVCPVGHLLGLYALLSPLEWRANDKSVCATCKTKDCVVRKNHYRLTGRSCTSNLYPATIRDNRACLLCTQCLKACPYNNIRLSVRLALADALRRLRLRSAELGFVVMVAAFVVYEILSEWPVSKAILTWIPSRLTEALSISGPAAGFVSAVVMFLVIPTALFLALGSLGKAACATPLTTTARSLAVLLLPTMAAVHVLKAILKTTSRIPYWSNAFSDPVGVATAERVVSKTVVLDTGAVEALGPAVTFAALALLAGALAGTAAIWHKSPDLRGLGRSARGVLLLGATAYWAIFAVTIVAWRL